MVHVSTIFGQTTRHPVDSAPCQSDSAWSYSHTDESNNVYKQHSVSYAWVDGGTCYVNTRTSIYRVTLEDTDNPQPDNGGFCPQEYILTQYGLAQCDSSNGGLNIIPNPDPYGGPQCRDLFQKDGQAYTCDPNTNKATPIPNSDGTTTDPEDGRNIPNCLEGYAPSSTATAFNRGTGVNFNTWNCSPSIPDGSKPVTGDNGTTVYPDCSVEKPNSDGSKTRVYMDGSTATTHSDGTVTTTPPTTPPATGGGSTTGGTSGTGTTGGTSGTGTTGGTSGTGSTGSIGGTGGTGSTGGTSGTGGSGGVSGSVTTGGTGGTTGTDSGTGTTGGTSGGGSGSTGTTTPPTTSTGAGNCNDSGLTLEQKELCKANTNLNSIDTSLGSIKSGINDIPAGGQILQGKFDGVGSGSDSSYTGFTSLLGDMRNSYNTFANQISNAQTIYEQGFTFNPIANIVNSANLERCLTVSVFGGNNVFMDFISPLIYIKPITSLIIQILMLIEVLRMCFLIINYTRSIF